ncbi:immunoglobulin-like domain-containing protein [Gracilibacillus kekensis]|uniref:Galactose oxidase, central domain n=1 Tax=Gracilibacillus kekensis TaxID=1027249 RepID=A0A1M7PZZ0_9BACI|nr:immunoglobulin-like domain-containing protein [Gracilibacillus kekensis]SHN23391.1 Galactose oxidase, central domain [Gracilibacillus kekensis]
MKIKNRSFFVILLIFLLVFSIVPIQVNASGYGQTFDWEKVSDTIPPDRAYPGIVYDEKNGQVVLFGGSSGSPLCEGDCVNDMWVWDGNTWEEKTKSTDEEWPAVRAYPSVVYDQANGYVLMFGGLDNDDNRLDDTWIWDGETWEQLNPVDSPTPVDSASITYDAANQEVVLFGGMIENEDTINETWTWNGENWTKENPANAPSNRQASGMVYDELNQEVVLFGGGTLSENFNDTWIWDGSDWKEKTLDVNPVERSYMGSIYDGTSMQVFGGSRLNDRWKWDGNSWSKVDDTLPIDASSVAGKNIPIAFDRNRKQFIFVFEDVWIKQLPMVNNIDIKTDVNATGATANWTTSFTTSLNGSLEGDNDTITIHAPEATQFAENETAYRVNGEEVNQIQRNDNVLIITTPVDINADSSVTVELQDVTNPNQEATLPKQFGVSTSVDVQTSYPETAPMLYKPHLLTLNPTNGSLLPDEILTISGQITSENGIPVTGAAIHFNTTAGTLKQTKVITDQSGNYQLTFIAPNSFEDVEITGKVGDVEASSIYKISDVIAPEIDLNGDNKMTIEAGYPFEDPGVKKVSDNSGEILTEDVEVSGEVDISQLGTYEIIYSVEDSSGNVATVTRKVYVVDTEQPVITLNGEKELTIEVGDQYVETGAEATDNLDGNISDELEIVGEVDTSTIGTYEVTYNITDSEGNEAVEKVRTVSVVDSIAPRIELNGENPLRWEIGKTYIDPGVTVTDNYDDDLLADIQIEGEVDSANEGLYSLTYKVQDSSGNETQVKRDVNVVSVESMHLEQLPIAVRVGEDSSEINVTITYSDGTTRDVTQDAKYQLNDGNALHVNDGEITGEKAQVNPVTVDVAYGGVQQSFSLRVVDEYSEIDTTVEVQAKDLFWLQGSETYIKMPEDLPEGTTVQVIEATTQANELQKAGELFDFQFTYPEGFDDYTGTFQLIMGTDNVVDEEKTAIYHFNEAAELWELDGGVGSIEGQRITTEVSDFSTYGVFTDTKGPINLEVTEDGRTHNSITLSFSAQDPSGIAEYILYRDGEKVATLSDGERSFVDEGLDQKTSYSYTVIAVDELGNQTEEVLTVTTEKKQSDTIEMDSTEKTAMENEKPEEQLPATATNTYNWLIISGILLFLGLITYLITSHSRKRIQ